MKPGWQPKKWLYKKAKRGVRSYPLGTIAFYGPDNRRASKVAVGIVPGPHSEVSELRRWFAEAGDLRSDDAVLTEVALYLREHGVQSVAMMDRIFGCPHEEGIDYPEGGTCPECPFWANRDRLTGLSTAE